MTDDPPTITEQLLESLMIVLLRKGVIDDDDLIEAAEGVAQLGGDAATAAHLVNCAIMRASAPSMSEWRAEQARRRFTVIRSNDGGNDEA